MQVYVSQGLVQTSWSRTHSRQGRSRQWSGTYIEGKWCSPLTQVRHAEVWYFVFFIVFKLDVDHRLDFVTHYPVSPTP